MVLFSLSNYLMRSKHKMDGPFLDPLTSPTIDYISVPSILGVII
jgi:hypothetical protein